MYWDPYAEFESTVLPNGLTIQAAHWPDRPWQLLGFVIHSGAEQDPVGREGLAHFVEHMINANAPLPNDELLSFFTNSGGWVNLGVTGYDCTQFSFFVPADSMIIRQALSLFGTMLLHTQLTELIEREREVIRSEFRMNFPLAIKYELRKREREALYAGHWLERFVRPIGHLESIAEINHSDLQSFYDTHYTPANMTVVGVGGMSLSSLTSLVANSPFAAPKPGKRTPLPLSVAAVDPPKELHYEFHYSTHISSSANANEYQCDAVIPGVVNQYALTLVSEMLDHLIHQEVRLSRSWSYRTECAWHDFRHFYEFSINCAALPLEAVDDVEGVIADCIESIPSRQDLFLDCKQRKLARSRMFDGSGRKIFNESLDDIGSYHRIKSLAEIDAGYCWLTLDDVVEILPHLKPDRRRVVLFRP